MTFFFVNHKGVSNWLKLLNLKNPKHDKKKWKIAQTDKW